MVIGLADLFPGFAFGANYRPFKGSLNGDSITGAQKHHLLPTAEANGSDFLKALYQWGVASPEGSDGYYNHNEFSENGIQLFTDAKVAEERGTAVHNGSHPRYSENLVRPVLERLETGLIIDAQTEYDRLKLTGLSDNNALETLRTDWLPGRMRLAAQDRKGVQASLHSGLTADFKSGDGVRPRYALNNKDVFITGRDLESEYNKINLEIDDPNNPIFKSGREGTYSRIHADLQLRNAAGNLIQASERAALHPNFKQGDATEAARRSASKINLLHNTSKLGGDVTGSVGGRTAAALAIGAVAINGGLWVKDQIDAGRSLDDIFSELLETVDGDALLAAGTSLAVGALATAAVGVFLGPIGVGALLAWDLISSWDEFREALDSLAEATPDWELLQQVTGFLDEAEGSVRNIIGSIESTYKSITNDVQDLAGLFVDALPKVQIGSGAVVLNGRDGRDLMIGDEGVTLRGLGGNDWLIHKGFGEVLGGSGGDTLVGWRGTTLAPGVLIDPELRAEEQALVASYKRALQDWILGGRTGDAPKKPEPLDGTRATSDLQLRLDGGSGDDWVVALGGTSVITAGGSGRDWIFNTSADGELWGDYASGVDDQGERAEDVSGNSDNFWYFPDTTIMDAQHYDLLKFFGIPLTGGDAAASLVGLALGAATGSLQVASGVIGAANAAAFSTGNQVYFDHLLPFITYKRDGKDLLVGNIFDGFFKAVTGRPGIFNAVPDGEGGSINASGVMRIKNFDFVSSYWGFEQFALGQGLSDLVHDPERPAGTMNMVFKDGNPLLAVLQMIAALPPIAGTGALGIQMQLLATLDAVLTPLAAMSRSAKAAAWVLGKDPLVIDLDGDGIETVDRNDRKIYFDVDGDLFAERTGWLKGDDGFLVRDLNRNGRIDDIGEMFGARFEGGLDDLAQYDSDGDGRITVGDLIWSELQVWQDYDQDGVTDAGELKSLDQLGIVSLSLQRNALDTVTPQGAQLLGSSTVTFASGLVTRMFEAILPSSDTDTRYAGEAGRPDWQADLALDSKGFGSIADLSVAMANDIGLGELVSTRAAAMTAPKLKTLVAQVGDVLGRWGETLERTRELTPVLTGTDENGRTVLVDRGVYVEDKDGGYWTRASGQPVSGQDGQPIVRPTLEQLLALGGE